jgi:hypothetical protein
MGWAERAASLLAMLPLSCLASGFTAAGRAGLVRRVTGAASLVLYCASSFGSKQPP